MDDVRRISLSEMPDGLHADVPEETYHAPVLGMVSKGSLVKMARSPLHYKNWVDGLDDGDDTPALIFGRVFHAALLEPGRFDREYVTEPDFGDCRVKANKMHRDAWRQVNAGKTPVSDDDSTTIRRMVTAVRAHPLAGKMIEEGVSELTALWTDKDTGLRCRARADRYFERLGMLLDVKSTLDAGFEPFRRDIFKHRYHWQNSLYREGFAAAGAEIKHFIFVAVEKTPPYAVAIYTLDEAGVTAGYQKTHEQMTRMAECLQKNEWPGYSPSIQMIDTPPWAA